jgi:hypothetical protein
MDLIEHQALIPSGTHVLTAVYGDDLKLMAEFFTEPVQQMAESKAAGRPIFKDVPHIRIRYPGDPTRETIRPVRTDPNRSRPYPPDPERFPRQWAAFQARQVQPLEGTPLEQWPPLSRSQVLELKAVHVHTVEQLAGVPDSAMHNLGMGGRSLRAQAQAWLADAKDGAATAALAAENEQLKERLAALEARFDQASAEKKPAARKKENLDAQA